MERFKFAHKKAAWYQLRRRKQLPRVLQRLAESAPGALTTVSGSDVTTMSCSKGTWLNVQKQALADSLILPHAQRAYEACLARKRARKAEARGCGRRAGKPAANG